MKNKQMIGGALLSYGAIAFNIIAGLLYTPWMIRTVGDDQYALYALAISIINLFMMDFGIGASVTRFLSNYYARGEQERADRFMGLVYKVFFLISAVIALCLFVFYFLIEGIYAGLTVAEIQVFKRLFVIVAAYSVLSFPFTSFNGVLMANERFIEVKACNLGQKVLNVALIVAALLAGSGVYALVLVNAVSNVVFVGVKFLLVRRKTATRAVFSGHEKGLAGELIGYSVWSTVMTISQRCIFNIAPTVIAALTGSAEVTMFSLAASLEGYVYTFSDAINGMFMPKISRIFARESVGSELTDLMGRVGKFHVYTLGLIYIGFACLGPRFVALWMGEGYESVYFCALLLIAPSLLDLPQQVARTAMLTGGYIREQSFAYLAMAVTNLALFFVFIPRFGVVGAALSVCAAYFVRTAVSNVLYRKKLPVNLAAYFKSAYGRWLLVAATTVVFGFVLARWCPMGAGWLGFALQGAVLVAVYVVLTLLIGLSREEKSKLLRRAGREH